MAEAAVASCTEAISMLKTLSTPSTSGSTGKGKAKAAVKQQQQQHHHHDVPKTLLDDLASAYTWHGICSRDCGAVGTDRSFRAAAALWTTLMNDLDSSKSDEKAGSDSAQNGANAAFFRAPERTVALLEGVATLFGLLEQSMDQVVVFRLIELMNSRVKISAGASNVDVVSSLSNAGHSMHRMGYLAVAKSHFVQAAEALDGVRLDYLLHHSQYLVAKGNVNQSHVEIDRALKEAKRMKSPDDAVPALAAASSILADAAFLEGQPAAAVAMAEHAFRLRVSQNRTASREAEIKSEVAGMAVAGDRSVSEKSGVESTSDHPRTLQTPSGNDEGNAAVGYQPDSD
jgi:hypothetical protein